MTTFTVTEQGFWALASQTYLGPLQKNGVFYRVRPLRGQASKCHVGFTFYEIFFLFQTFVAKQKHNGIK